MYWNARCQKKIFSVCQSHISCISGVENFWDSNNVKVTMDKSSRLNFVKQQLFSLNAYLQPILTGENYTITDIPRCFVNALLFVTLSLHYPWKSERNIIAMFSVTINLRALILFIALCTLWKTEYGRPTVVASPKSLQNIYHCFVIASP